MGRAVLESGAAILGLLGGIIGAYGTYLLTRWSLPLGFWGVLGRMWEILWMFVTFQKHQIIQELKFDVDFAGFLNQDNKEFSLYGAYLVLIGFVIQNLGAVLALVAAVSPAK